MEISLRHPGLRPRPAALPEGPGAMPRLRVWPAERLLLHEEAEPVRVRRLADALRRDGVLRNPPIVAPVADGRAVVLDGANRVTALRALGLSHIVVQAVSYDDPGVRLSVWRHYAAEDVPGTLRAAAAAAGLGEIAPVDGEAGAAAQIDARTGIAAILDARGGAVVRGTGHGAAEAEALCRLTALYRDGRPVHRVHGGTLDDLRAAHGPGALVLFRRFEAADILNLALAGNRLPAGITLHVIPGRALRLNTPLAWLSDGIDPAAKQAALDAQLRQRWEAHGVRYYAEPTFLFDE